MKGLCRPDDDVIMFICMTFWKRQNFNERKLMSGCQGLAGKGVLKYKMVQG